MSVKDREELLKQVRSLEVWYWANLYATVYTEKSAIDTYAFCCPFCPARLLSRDVFNAQLMGLKHLLSDHMEKLREIALEKRKD